MTNEEAKVFLLQLHTDKQLNKSEHEALRVAIKALETPPDDNWEGYSKRLWKAAYDRGKAEAEQARWIPVSERLPEEEGIYLVTTTGTNNDIIDIAFYVDGIWHKASRIKAWMPLPEPYKAESKLDGDPIDIDKAVEHYEGTLETLKGIDLEDNS